MSIKDLETPPTYFLSLGCAVPSTEPSLHYLQDPAGPGPPAYGLWPHQHQVLDIFCTSEPHPPDVRANGYKFSSLFIIALSYSENIWKVCFVRTKCQYFCVISAILCQWVEGNHLNIFPQVYVFINIKHGLPRVSDWILLIPDVEF